MANYVCDLCGFQSEDRAAILAHFASKHPASEPAEVGSMTQEDGRLILRSGADVTAVDLDAWLGACICGHAEEDHGPSGACEVDGCLCAAFETYEDEETR